MIRVLHLDTGREWRGGQQQVLYLHRELCARGHRSIVVTPTGSPLARRVRDENLPLREILYHGSGDPIALFLLVKLIQETEAQILHAHTAHAHNLGFLALRLPGLPRDRRPAFVVHRRVDFPPSADPLTRMRYTTDPCLFLCVSDAVRRVLLSRGVPEDRLRVVHSCIDPARIDREATGDPASLRIELGLPPESSLIGAVGALVPHKGHRHLLAAMPKVLSAHPEAHLVLFGDGPLESELRRESWERKMQSRVLFAGFRSDVHRFFPALDLLAHPSVEEGLGTSILDAMAARLPVVASRAGGIPEVVRHGETGWLVPPASPTELAGAIVSLIDDPRRRHDFGEAGRRRVVEGFSVPVLADQVIAAYEEAGARVAHDAKKT